MPLWIPITIAAVLMQNFRFMLQKHLKTTRLSTGGATFARFVFAAPVALLVVFLLTRFGWDLPRPTTMTWVFIPLGGVAQIIATMFVVALFAERNFSVGITLKKTETLLTAVVSMILLGERISVWGVVAILIGICGVLVLADPPERKDGARWQERVFNRASFYGVGAGAFFGVSATSYRGASLSLDSGDFIIRALVCLAAVTTFQSVIMSIWLRFREPGEMTKVFKAWRLTSLTGFAGVTASAGLFMALTLQYAAYVKALGQVELIFSMLASTFFFKETSTRREYIGIALVMCSIFALLL
ncbi:MAG: hypothetical protein COB84_10350, partial [Rhodobacteraceae bacterium]